MTSLLRRAWKLLRLAAAARAMRGTPVDTTQQRVLLFLARQARAFRLPMPRAILPHADGWLIKVANLDVLVMWGKALRIAPMLIETRYVDIQRKRWVLRGLVHGVPIQIWAPCRRYRPPEAAMAEHLLDRLRAAGCEPIEPVKPVPEDYIGYPS